MVTIAYLANQFPSAVEPYVVEEIEELGRRGVRIVTGTVRRPCPGQAANGCVADVRLLPPSAVLLLSALWLCARRWKRISSIFARVLFQGTEGPVQRLKALGHTWLGACYAVCLAGRGIDHIHVHHGYFGSWIAMVAARLLNVGFSMTLHGSDLLLHAVYLDAKLESCTFCLTVSSYNRNYILDHYPGVDPKKVVVARLGVNVAEHAPLLASKSKASGDSWVLLAVGRLHAVKDHAFLVRACAELRSQDVRFECWIAGDGPERRALESDIRECDLEGQVKLLGHVPREQMDSLYDRADVVVLTSRSEGVPLVLMEAMARGRIVLAPEITGIPELVIAGKTGFLYQSGSLSDFVARLLFVRSLMQSSDHPQLHPYLHPYICSSRQLDWIRHAARVQVRHNFNRTKNLELFADLFLERIIPQTESTSDENFVLQQI